MASREQQVIQVLNILIAHEELMRALYHECARLYPAHRNLWAQFATEERGHTMLLQTLVGLAAEGRLTIRGNSLTVEKLVPFTEYICKGYLMVAENTLPLVDALHVILDMEDTVSERHFVSNFTGDAAEIQTIIQRMLAQSREHIDILKALHRGIAVPLSA